MKGLVFTEFVDFMESSFGLEVSDRVIEEARLPSSGAYTTVASYDHRELVEMLRQLARQSARPGPELLERFGRHLFKRLARAYPELILGLESTLEVLRVVEGRIHAEVRKLYPEAELPSLDCTPIAGGVELTYRSSRALADLAAGMIAGCVEHFGEALRVREQDLSGGQRTHVRFTVAAA